MTQRTEKGQSSSWMLLGRFSAVKWFPETAIRFQLHSGGQPTLEPHAALLHANRIPGLF